MAGLLQQGTTRVSNTSDGCCVLHIGVVSKLMLNKHGSCGQGSTRVNAPFIEPMSSAILMLTNEICVDRAMTSHGMLVVENTGIDKQFITPYINPGKLDKLLKGPFFPPSPERSKQRRLAGI
eukprot:1136240-Pelagomonas_calceolata.AAC.5